MTSKNVYGQELHARYSSKICSGNNEGHPAPALWKPHLGGEKEEVLY